MSDHDACLECGQLCHTMNSYTICDDCVTDKHVILAQLREEVDRLRRELSEQSPRHTEETTHGKDSHYSP